MRVEAGKRDEAGNTGFDVEQGMGGNRLEPENEV